MPPQFTYPDGKTCEGPEAVAEALKRLSDLGMLAIPNRPMSDKPVQFIFGSGPPDGDYRSPLTEDELDLLRKVVPDLSIRAVDTTPELFDPKLEFFLRDHYHMGDARIRTLTWAQIFDACERFLAAQQKGKDAPSCDDGGTIDSETSEQAWQDNTSEYITNADAVRMAGGKISASALSKSLRKPGNTIRWMRNEKAHRSKVHTQDFKKYMLDRKAPGGLSEEAVRHMLKTKKEIDARKREAGKQ